MNKLVTPPSHHHTSRTASTSSDTVSDEFDDASVVLDESGSLGPFLNAMVAKSKEIESIEVSNENLITPASSPELDNYESRYPDDSYIDVMMSLLDNIWIVILLKILML